MVLWKPGVIVQAGRGKSKWVCKHDKGIADKVYLIENWHTVGGTGIMPRNYQLFENTYMYRINW